MEFTAVEVRAQLTAARVYLVMTRTLCRHAPEDVLRAALAAGVDVVQVRETEATDREALAWAREVRRATAEAKVPMIVNDRPDLAMLAEADGVHVGQSDISPADVRRLVGPDPIIGLSTHAAEELDAARVAPVDYVGFGPCFDTSTKRLAGLGLECVRSAAKSAAEARLKMFAIGGVSPQSVGGLASVGVLAVAVSSAVCGAEDPGAVIRTLRAALP